MEFINFSPISSSIRSQNELDAQKNHLFTRTTSFNIETCILAFRFEFPPLKQFDPPPFDKRIFLAGIRSFAPANQYSVNRFRIN